MLQFNYGLMLASEDLLRDAGMEEDLDEEREHLAWLKEDLNSLGIAIPSYDYIIACVAGSQYYFIHHAHPQILLGYRAALECRPMPIGTGDVLEREWGRLQCLRYHAIHDIDRGHQIIKRIEAIEDTWLLGQLTLNAASTAKTIFTTLQMRLHASAQDAEPYYAYQSELKGSA